MTDKEYLHIITYQLLIVRDNLFRGMSKSIQKLQAKAINEALELADSQPAQPAQEPVCDKDPQGCWNVRCQLGKQCKNLAQPAPGYCKNCKDYTIEEPLYAQPAQEPVAWAIYDKRGGSKSLHWPENHSPDGDATKFDAVPLYTTPPQPTQEPVAWLEPEWGEKICPEVGYEATITDDHPRDLCWIPLYTAPPQREWVGLTDEEIKEIIGPWGDTPVKGYTRKLFDQIEAKLRSKNNG